MRHTPVATMASAGAAVLVTLVALSCRGPSSPGGTPTASLAGTRSAQEAFRPLKQRFASASPARRAELEPRLFWFVEAFPNDGEVPLARVYLALIAVDRGDLAVARRQLALLEAAPQGNTRDLGELVWAALHLRAGEHERAFARLLPLVGKLIDPYARTLLDQQMVAASLGTARWYEAVGYMDLWLRDAAEQDEEAVQEQVRRALEAVPSQALELMMQTTLQPKGPSSARAAVRKAALTRLAAVAIDQQDTGLARRLVDSAAGTQALGDASEALHELAESGGAPSIEGRSMGLLLSTGATHLGARAAEVLNGVVDALRADSSNDGVRMVTRDERDPKRTELAMLSLASQGAAVLIAGLDEPQAQVAAAFAQRTGIPVMSLVAFTARIAGDSAKTSASFSLGAASEGGGSALLEALDKRGARMCAVVGGEASSLPGSRVTFTENASCNATPVQAGEPRFPLVSWRTAKADCVLVLGDASCATDVLDEAVPRVTSLRFAGLGLEAADLADAAQRLPLWVVAAGHFPLQHGDAASPLGGYVRRQGRAPSWFAALGHDAAVLAREALRALPSDRAEAPDEVARRHRATISALANARTELWTTGSPGFVGARVLPRELVVREVR